MEQETVYLLANLLVAAILPFVAQPLNEWLRLDGPKALVAVGLLAAVLSLVSLFVTGGLTLQDFTLANFSQVFTLVFTVSQFVFQSLKEKLGWTNR